jgi:peptidoglycan/LPS O-acetylase OafA/YrhL
VELIAAVVIAGPLGYALGRRGLAVYLALWAIVFPIQTIVVHSENPDDIVVAYFVINGLILALGIGLNRLGAWSRRNRSGSASPASRPSPAGGDTWPK